MSLSLGLGLALTRNKGGWSPALLGSSLLGWWDAERAGTLSLSGGSVSSWTDRVSGQVASQAVGASKPLYSATGLNGRPCVSFDGADDELTLPSVPFPAGSDASEIWALVDQKSLTGDAATRVIFRYGGVTNASRAIQRAGANNAQVQCGTGGASAVNGLTGGTFFGPQVIRGVFSGSTISVELSGVANPPSAAVPATETVRTRIGAGSNTTASNFFYGSVSQIMVTALLSAPQREKMLTYLKARGGIS